MILHAVAQQHSPAVSSLLHEMALFFSSWRTFNAPDGYNAIHIRTGKAPLDLGGGVQLPAVPWKDSNVCKGKCSSWLTEGPGIARSRAGKPHLPVSIASDSNLIVGLMQQRYWESLPLLHCCGSSSHVTFHGQLSDKDHLTVFKQAVFDLVMLGNAKRLFVSLGGFWSLGVHWWTPNATVEVYGQFGPASTLPHLA